MLSISRVLLWFPGPASSLRHSHYLFGFLLSWTQHCKAFAMRCTANPFSSPWALLSAQNQLEFLDLFLGCWRTLEDSQSPCMPEPATFPVLSAILGHRPHPLSYCHQKFQMEASCKFFLPLAPQLQGRSIILPWDSA